ncbi:MAG: hypothetical protein AAFQ83_22970 [Bacteroidota bacterium]
MSPNKNLSETASVRIDGDLSKFTLDDVSADGLVHLSSAFEDFGNNELINTTKRVLLEAADTKRKLKGV